MEACFQCHHYKIYYKKSASSQWIGLATVSGNTTSYTHTNSNKTPIIPGQKYTYTVKGYNSKYNTNGPYNSKGLTISTKLDTVKLKNAVLSKDQKSVTVSWNGLPKRLLLHIPQNSFHRLEADWIDRL